MVLNSKCWFLYGYVLPTGAIGPVGTHRTDYSHSDPQCIATAWYLSIVDLLATAWYRLVYTECYSVLIKCVCIQSWQCQGSVGFWYSFVWQFV